ncbi:uncharacterized protein LOC144431166 [Styela clava]
MYGRITVCPDECIAKLHATSTVETGGGLPDPVTDARVIQDNTNTKYCTVIWSWSDRTPRSNAIFQITTVSTLVKLSANIEQQTYSNEQSYAGGTLEYFQVQIETKPNRNYSFYIKTKIMHVSPATRRKPMDNVLLMWRHQKQYPHRVHYLLPGNCKPNL